MASWARKLPSLDTLKRKLRQGGSTTPDNSLNVGRSPLQFHLKSPSPEPYASEEVGSVSEEEQEDAVYDQSDNLARDVREFYERRLLSSEIIAKKWGSEANNSEQQPTSPPGNKGELSPSSACSSGYFSLNPPPSMSVFSSPPKSKEGDDEGLGSLGDESASETETCDTSSIKPSRNGEFPNGTSLQSKLDFLKGELLGLIHQDNDLFKQLLTLNDTIEELKESRTGVAAPLAPPSMVSLSPPPRLERWEEESEETDREEEGDENSDEQEINDLLDEALDLTSDEEEEEDVETTADQIDQLHIQQEEVTVATTMVCSDQVTVGGSDQVTVNARRILPQPPMFHLDTKQTLLDARPVLRSQSVIVRVPCGFQRQRVSFPATGKNRRKDNTPPVKRELPWSQFGTLPAALKSKRQVQFPLRDGATAPVPAPRSLVLPVPPPRDMPPVPLPRDFTVLPSPPSNSDRLPFGEVASELFLRAEHVKQSSFDSGLMSGTLSSPSVSSRGSSDSAAEETSSEMGA